MRKRGNGWMSIYFLKKSQNKGGGGNIYNI